MDYRLYRDDYVHLKLALESKLNSTDTVPSMLKARCARVWRSIRSLPIRRNSEKLQWSSTQTTLQISVEFYICLRLCFTEHKRARRLILKDCLPLPASSKAPFFLNSTPDCCALTKKSSIRKFIPNYMWLSNRTILMSQKWLQLFPRYPPTNFADSWASWISTIGSCDRWMLRNELLDGWSWGIKRQ